MVVMDDTLKKSMNESRKDFPLYPFGKNEVSAFSFLKAQGVDWLGRNIDRILQIEEQNFSTASATITMAQDIQ